MRSRLWVMAGTISCVLALAIGAVWGWVAWTGRQTATMPVPPVSASSTEVATAYVAALNAHDCGAAKTLSTSDGADTTVLWCSQVRSIVVSTWGTPRSEAPLWSEHQAPQEVVLVPATITVTWRPFHDGGSMSSVGWGHLLVRENSTAPWRVADQGVG